MQKTRIMMVHEFFQRANRRLSLITVFLVILAFVLAAAAFCDKESAARTWGTALQLLGVMCAINAVAARLKDQGRSSLNTLMLSRIGAIFSDLRAHSRTETAIGSVDAHAAQKASGTDDLPIGERIAQIRDQQENMSKLIYQQQQALDRLSTEMEAAHQKVTELDRKLRDDAVETTRVTAPREALGILLLSVGIWYGTMPPQALPFFIDRCSSTSLVVPMSPYSGP